MLLLTDSLSSGDDEDYDEESDDGGNGNGVSHFSPFHNADICVKSTLTRDLLSLSPEILSIEICQALALAAVLIEMNGSKLANVTFMGNGSAVDYG